VDQAFLAVHLPKEALAAPNLGAVLLVVGSLLVRQDVTKRRVRGQVEATDFEVDVADRPELPRQIDVGLDVDGLEPIGESPGFRGPVILLDVLA
jgi:hypothetical protein